MEKIGWQIAGGSTALLAALIIFWLHTNLLPNFLAEKLDTWTPRGAESVWSDLSPEDRVTVLTEKNGAVVRGVRQAPVYLLWEPRVQSKNISVDLWLAPEADATNTVAIGYRTAAGSENNVLRAATFLGKANGWQKWRVTNLPLAEMLVEHGSARRLVLQLPVSWIKAVRIWYE